MSALTKLLAVRGKTIADVDCDVNTVSPADECLTATLLFTDGTQLELSVTNNEGVFVWTDAP